MSLIPHHRTGILATSLQPGDVALKMNQSADLGAGWQKWGSKSVIGNLIGGLSAFNPEYVHGGLSVGQGRLIDDQCAMLVEQFGDGIELVSLNVEEHEIRTIRARINRELIEHVALR